MGLKITIQGDVNSLVEYYIDKVNTESERAQTAQLKKDQRRHHDRAQAFREALEYLDVALRSNGRTAVELRRYDDVVNDFRDNGQITVT
jgi:hypothetical protein